MQKAIKNVNKNFIIDKNRAKSTDNKLFWDFFYDSFSCTSKEDNASFSCNSKEENQARINAELDTIKAEIVAKSIIPKTERELAEQAGEIYRDRRISQIADYYHSLPNATSDEPYAVKKQMIYLRGIKQVINKNNEQCVVMPICDEKGNFISLEVISLDKKRFMAGGRTKGGFFILGEDEAIKNPDVIFISEGLATAEAVYQLFDRANEENKKAIFIVATSGGNLEAVANAMDKKYPFVKEKIITADNDASKPIEENIGLKYAKETADRTNFKKVITPTATEQGKNIDWSDAFLSNRGEAVMDFWHQVDFKPFYEGQQDTSKTVNRNRDLDLVAVENADTQEVTAENLGKYDPKWLIKGSVERNKLISLYAMAGSGKSITALYLAVYMLEQGIISKVVYIDMDNGFSTLKKRGLDKLKAKYGDKLKYISSSVKSKTPTDPSRLISGYSKKADESCKDTLIVFDNITNFIKGSMSYDEVVKPTLDALRNMRDFYAGVWFLNHQSKQDFNGENNKAYKGATSFFDKSDESYFVQKKERKESKLTVTLEPMKKRDDTKPLAVIIDTENLSLEFTDYLMYSMSEKQALTMEYVKEVLADKTDGINLKEFVIEIKRRAKNDRVADHEICGTRATQDLIKQFAGIFYKMVKGEKNSLMFYPLDLE